MRSLAQRQYHLKKGAKDVYDNLCRMGITFLAPRFCVGDAILFAVTAQLLTSAFIDNFGDERLARLASVSSAACRLCSSRLVELREGLDNLKRSEPEDL
jgi:hypothetical protein